jgi:hypothetical protein
VAVGSPLSNGDWQMAQIVATGCLSQYVPKMALLESPLRRAEKLEAQNPKSETNSNLEIRMPETVIVGF